MRRFLTILATLVFIIVSNKVYGFVDDFDDGDITGWTVVTYNDVLGNAEASTSFSHSPGYSMRTWRDGSQMATAVQKDDFSAATGTYEAWFYVTGSVADGWMLFHYTDRDNNYRLSCRPLGTDSPELRLTKVVNGSTDLLATVPATFNLNEWFKATIERLANGDINVFINDTPQISVNDTDFMDPAGFCVGSWQEAYVDDVSYKTVKVPGLSGWSILILILMLLSIGTFLLRRRKILCEAR